MSQRPEKTRSKAGGGGSPPPRKVAFSTDPLALSRKDWIALGLLAAALILAPLWAANFATPIQVPFTSWEAVSGPLILLLLALAFGLVVWREWKRPVAIGAVPGLAGAFALMGAWAAISLIHSPALHLSLNALAALFAVLLAGGLASRLARDRNGLLILLLAVVLGGSLTAGIGIYEYLDFWKQGAREHRTFSTFLNPDFLAGYLLLTLPITLALFAAVTDKIGRLTLGLGLALQSVCLLLTGSLAGAAGLLIALLVWLGLAASSGAAAGRWKQLGVGILIVAIGIVLGFAPTRSRVSAGQAGKSAAGAPSPLAAASAAQGHSVLFRKWTWIGTVRLVRANPLFGSGIGSFPVAYVRYAETAFTNHAHNSYLQWTGEVGIPGGLLLLTGFAAATAFGAGVLYLRRFGTQKDDPEPAPDTRSAAAPLSWLRPFSSAEPRLILAGLLSAAAASLLHSLWDSDWFIVVTALTLSVTLALLVAQARDIAPLATQRPRTMGREIAVIGLLAAGFVLWRAGTLAVSRPRLTLGNELLTTALQTARDSSDTFKDRLEQASVTFQSAASADPFDPEPHLLLAGLHRILESNAAGQNKASEAQNEAEKALQEYKAAARMAPSGRPYYLLGRFYADHKDWKPALEALEQARTFDPHNLQTMRALAETQSAAGQPEVARHTYQAMTFLETQPFGTVRAVPQIVETDFAYAHAGLAKIAADTRQWSEADKEYALADHVLSEYWPNRNQEANLTRSSDKRKGLARLYTTVLEEWKTTLRQEGRQDEENRIAQKLAAIETDLREENENERQN